MPPVRALFCGSVVPGDEELPVGFASALIALDVRKTNGAEGVFP
jgi:hypothetical protein